MHSSESQFYDRVALKGRARALLSENRSTCIAVELIFVVISAVASVSTLGIAGLLLTPPLAVGISLFSMRIWRGVQPRIETIFKPFNRYLQSLIGILWMGLWTFLWSLLLVIPGIIKGLSYAMTPYLLADFPGLDAREALKVSIAITSGHLMEILVLYLSFLGWIILASFTFGILHILHVGPYMNIAFAGLYDKLLADAIAERRIHAHDLERWSEGTRI